MNRQDLLLNQMGISQWRLRRPDALKGAVNVVVGDNVRLIVLAETPLLAQDPFVRDVLRSAEISPEDSLFLDFNQAAHLRVNQDSHYWLLSQNQSEIDRTLPLCLRPISLWQSPDLTTLKQDPSAKRSLWQAIQGALKQD
ncbi:DNA polymerase III subunit psi [Pasteurellaceae bacterium Pebbles2]|nr:DNA polymerase III subunit psi [Pasteurellaceae bacterium Pebbles2]